MFNTAYLGLCNILIWSILLLAGVGGAAGDQALAAAVSKPLVVKDGSP